MNSAATTERERRLLASVASDYEKRGYQVKVQPGVADMPEFLAGFEPDLIATGTGESVIVEVKARKDLKNEQTLAAMEAALRNRPGWRFELVIDGSEHDLGPLLGASQIWTSLEEANELQQGGHFKASFLLLWSATEGILRLLATRENIELESLAPGYVTTRLYTLGLIGREQYRVLDEALQLRNQAVHGFQVAVTHQDLANVTTANVTTIARELLSEVESEAA